MITPEGTHRQPITKILTDSGFSVTYIEQLRDATQVINDLEPGVILHDWDNLDKDQSVFFHQMIAKMNEFVNICRIVFSKKITPNLIALSADTGIDRVISLTSLKVNIAQEINMVRSAISSVTEMQELVRSLNSNSGKYSQQEIDQVVSDSYKQYPHDQIVKLEFGNLCFRNSKLAKAKTIAKELLNQNEYNVRAMSLMSRIHMKEKNFDAALSVLENANILSPKNSKRLLSLADLCVQKGDKVKARGYFNEALEAYPEDKEVATTYAKFEITEDNPNAALEIFKKSMSEEEVAGILNNSGVQAVRNNDISDSMKFYSLAIDSLKTNRLMPQIYFNMALAQRRLHQYEEALTYANRVLELDPEFKKAKKQIQELNILIKQDERAQR